MAEQPCLPSESNFAGLHSAQSRQTCVIKLEMRAALLIALLAIVAFVHASDVLDLTPDNFDEVVGQADGVFVEFFAPWFECSICARFFRLAVRC